MLKVFNYFTERTPKSFVEKESTFISWHYRDCDREFGELQARDLLMHLVAGPLVNTSTEVVHSSKLIQVRPAGVSKGAFPPITCTRPMLTFLSRKHGRSNYFPDPARTSKHRLPRLPWRLP